MAIRGETFEKLRCTCSKQFAAFFMLHKGAGQVEDGWVAHDKC